MEDQSAFDILLNTLKYYGLVKEGDTALFETIKTAWTGKQIGPGDGPDEVGIALRDNETFQARFPANKALKDQGKPQYSVTRYLQLEGDYKAALQEAGLPADFYDQPSDFQAWIAGGTSVNEVRDRAQLGYQAVRQSNPQVIAEFKRLYGVNEGELAAYFIDPERMRPTFDRYEAERQARSAQIAAQATTQAGFTLGQQQAEELARAGVTQEQAQAGFTALGDTRELFQTSLAGEQQITQQEQIAGTFNTNAEARQKIAARRRGRQAAFESGGGFATGQTGVAGLSTVGQ
jgi:hypothetical protein